MTNGNDMNGILRHWQLIFVIVGLVASTAVSQYRIEVLAEETEETQKTEKVLNDTVIRIESEQTHLKEDVEEIKEDVKAIRDKMEEDKDEILEAIREAQ